MSASILSNNVFINEFASHALLFTGVNLVVWGTRAATWLNCPASPVGMAIIGIVQGTLLAVTNQLFDNQNRFIRIAITIVSLAIGAFAIFLLAKPLSAYIGIITVKAAIASTLLNSIIKIVWSVFSSPQTNKKEKNGGQQNQPYFPQTVVEVRSMTKEQLQASYKFLQQKPQKDKEVFWQSLPLVTRCAFWNELGEKQILDLQFKPVREKLSSQWIPPPISTVEEIGEMSTEDFRTFVCSIIPNYPQKHTIAGFWTVLPVEIWREIAFRKIQEQLKNVVLPFVSSEDYRVRFDADLKERGVPEDVLSCIYNMHYASNMIKRSLELQERALLLQVDLALASEASAQDCLYKVGEEEIRKTLQDFEDLRKRRQDFYQQLTEKHTQQIRNSQEMEKIKKDLHFRLSHYSPEDQDKIKTALRKQKTALIQYVLDENPV